MSETSTASSKSLQSQQLKESLMLQLQEQMTLHDKLEQQRHSVKNGNISNSLSGVPNFQAIQRNIPVPRAEKKQRNNNVNNYLLGIMRQQQLYQQQLHSGIDGQLSSGGINSTDPLKMQMVQPQQPMVQPLQQTVSHNLNSQFTANGTLKVHERVTPAQLRQLLSAQDAFAATQGQNASTSGLIQNGQPGAMQNATSPQPWFKQMQVIDPLHSLSHRLQKQRQLQLQQQSPRMVGPGDQKPVCLTGSQPDDATPGGSSSQSSNQTIKKRMIHYVVSQLDLNRNLDPEVEDLLFKIAGNFIDTVTTLACTLAKHPKSSTFDSKDVSLHPGSSKQVNSKSSFPEFSNLPQAVYCHCGLEATARTSSIQPNRETRFWCCSKLGGQQCSFFEWCDPEMCRRSNEIMPGILRRMSAQDATVNDLRIRCKELRIALVICAFMMMFMLGKLGLIPHLISIVV